MPVVVSLGLCLLIPLVIWKMSDVTSGTGAIKDASMTLGVIIPHVQITTWLLSLNLKWPDFVKHLGKWLGDLIFIDFGSLMTLECLTERKTQDKLKSFVGHDSAVFTDNLQSSSDLSLDFDDPGDQHFIKFMVASPGKIDAIQILSFTPAFGLCTCHDTSIPRSRYRA